MARKEKKKAIGFSRKVMLLIALGIIVIAGSWYLIDQKFSADPLSVFGNFSDPAAILLSSKGTGTGNYSVPGWLDSFSIGTGSYIESLPPTSMGKKAVWNIDVKDTKGLPIKSKLKISSTIKVRMCYVAGFKDHPDGGCKDQTIKPPEYTYLGSAIQQETQLFKLDQQTVKNFKVSAKKTLYFFGWYPDPKDTRVVAMWQSTTYTIKDSNGKKLTSLINKPPFQYTINAKSAISWADKLAKGKNLIVKINPAKAGSSVALDADSSKTPSTTLNAGSNAGTNGSNLTTFNLVVDNGGGPMYYLKNVSKNCKVTVRPYKTGGQYNGGASASCNSRGGFSLKVNSIDTSVTDAVHFTVFDQGGSSLFGSLNFTSFNPSLQSDSRYYIKDILKGGTLINQAGSSSANQIKLSCSTSGSTVTCHYNVNLKSNS